MHKKLMMACMAIAAFAAFVVAPAASASPVLTEGASALAVGASIEGKNTGETTFTGTFNVRCTTATMKGAVTSNSGTKIKGEIPVGGAVYSGTGTSGDCTSFFGSTKVTVTSKLCLETVTGADNVAITGCGGAILFDLQVTGLGVCEYQTAVAGITGTFKTNAGATVNVSEQPATLKSGSGFACPAEGKLDMDFDLYTTSNATQLTIS
jgi:hypothetical protein